MATNGFVFSSHFLHYREPLSAQSSFVLITEKVFCSVLCGFRLWVSVFEPIFCRWLQTDNHFLLHDCLECSSSRPHTFLLLRSLLFSRPHFFPVRKKRSSLWKFFIFSLLSNGIFRWRWLSIYLLTRPFINISLTLCALKISSIVEPFSTLWNFFTFDGQ